MEVAKVLGEVRRARLLARVFHGLRYHCIGPSTALHTRSHLVPGTDQPRQIPATSSRSWGLSSKRLFYHSVVLQFSHPNTRQAFLLRITHHAS